MVELTLASHIRLTLKFIKDSGVKLTKTEKMAMILGSILPDMYLVVKRHEGEDTAKNVKYHLNKIGLSVNKREMYCLQIGMIFHYTCDYFCKAHSYKYMFSFFKHWAYEKRLSKFIKRNIDTICGYSNEEISNYIAILESNHESYMCEMENAIEAYINDLKYSVITCEALMNRCFA